MYMLFLSAIVQAEPYTFQHIVLFHDYYPQCPEVCMYELAQAELQAAHQEGSRKFIYKPFIAFEDNSPVIADRKKWMKEAGLDTYEAYFVALAKSEKLSDEQKISDRFCQIPPIAALYAQEQTKREELLGQLWWKVGSDNHYPLRRIFEALLYRSNVQLEKKYTYDFAPLEEALLHDDTPLAVQLLKQGVNANGTNYSTIGLAKSVDIVRLLISYGADIKRQQKVHDLVYWAARRNEDYDRFSFFLVMQT